MHVGTLIQVRNVRFFKKNETTKQEKLNTWLMKWAGIYSDDECDSWVEAKGVTPDAKRDFQETQLATKNASGSCK